MEKVEIVAHRGDPSFAPENTIPAIERAVELKVDMIEFDVQLTKDGHFILMHDSTVDRTTNGKGRVHDLALSEIKELRAFSSSLTDENNNWVNKNFEKGEEIPTLEEAIKEIPAPIELNIHLKCFDTKLLPAMEKKILEMLSDTPDLKTRALPAIDYVESLERIRKQEPSVNCILLAMQDNAEKYIEAYKKYALKVMQPSRHLMSKEFIDNVHTLGIEANVFYADTEKDLKLFISYGVDGVLTNFPQKILELLK